MRLPQAAIDHFLEHWPVGRLATLRADGAPQLVPIVFARLDGRLYSPVDAKPKRSASLARLEHVRREPRVSLLLDEYDADWQRLWWLRVDGRARVVGTGEADLARVARALGAKYPQYARVAIFAGAPTCLEIEPLRLASWCVLPPELPGPAPSGAGA